MDVVREFGEISTIHGISDLLRSKSVKNKIFWTVALLGVAWFIPHNLISLLHDFQRAPTITLITRHTDDTGYPFPLIRFCPQSWVNSSRLAESGLDKDAFLYALSLLYHVIIHENVTNVTEAALSLRKYKKTRKIHMSQLYKNIANDVNQLFECKGCKNMTPIISILGVCYDLVFHDYMPTDTIFQNGKYRLIFLPPAENFSDPTNANNLYSSSFSSHVMYMDARHLDVFAFDPLFLEANESYEITVIPMVSERLSGKGHKQCMAEINETNSYDKCQLDCREALFGPECWGYIHYGLSFDTTKKNVNLSWYSSLQHYTHENESIQDCQERLMEQVLKCMHKCYSACHQWQYEIHVTEPSRSFRSSETKIGKMSAAQYFAWRQRLPSESKRLSDANAVSVQFSFVARYGVTVVEETNRRTAAAFISNLGGMMGLVAGASALSLCQLGECLIRAVVKRFSHITNS